MTCTICLLLLLVAEAVFFTEIYKQGKKMNSLFRICTYRNVQMTINESLRVNILCIINWLYGFCLTTSHTHLAVVKISLSFTHGWNGQLLKSGCP